MIDISKIKTAEQKQIEFEIAAQEQINREAKDFLSSTDWYVIRQQETGVSVPEEVLQKRQFAREQIKAAIPQKGA